MMHVYSLLDVASMKSKSRWHILMFSPLGSTLLHRLALVSSMLRTEEAK